MFKIYFNTFQKKKMGRRKKDRRNLSLSDEVNAFLDTLTATNDASATVDKAVRALREFKEFKKQAAKKPSKKE